MNRYKTNLAQFINYYLLLYNMSYTILLLSRSGIVDIHTNNTVYFIIENYNYLYCIIIFVGNITLMLYS